MFCSVIRILKDYELFWNGISELLNRSIQIPKSNGNTGGKADESLLVTFSMRAPARTSYWQQFSAKKYEILSSWEVGRFYFFERIVARSRLWSRNEYCWIMDFQSTRETKNRRNTFVRIIVKGFYIPQKLFSCRLIVFFTDKSNRPIIFSFHSDSSSFFFFFFVRN